MSLIDEALKRARMEAAQRAAEEEGLPYPVIPRHLTPRRRKRWLTAGALALAVAIGVTTGLLLARGGQPGAGSPETPEQVSETVGTPASETSADTVADLEPDPPAVSSAPADELPDASEARSDPPDEAPPIEDPEPRTASRQIDTGRPPNPAPAAGETVAPRPPSVVVDDPQYGLILVLTDQAADETPGEVQATGDEQATESFVSQLPIEDGGMIELGGIAWSDTGAFALLNGQLLEPGDSVETFTVEKIAPAYVILAGEGRRVQISLR